MQIVVLANAAQKAELGGVAVAPEVIWAANEESFFAHSGADVYVDLLFVAEPSRMQRLAALLPKTVVVNAVVETTAGLQPAFFRINGWSGFLSSTVVEAAGGTNMGRGEVETTFAAFGKTVAWLPDQPGFVTARVVSLIINEAYLALAEGVSTKAEIDTAMRLGTAYPFGPFEWAEKIGVRNVAALLQALGNTQPQYMPASLLVQEALTR